MSLPCSDCGADTAPCTNHRGCRHVKRWEYYMVHNDVWLSAEMDQGYLCIACLEQRLGRMLTSADFPDLRINEPSKWDTPLLKDRKERKP